MKRFSAILDSIETDLLGRQGLSFSIASKRTQWIPEDQAAVCWRCACFVGPHETDGDGCAGCRTQKLPWDRAIRLGQYDGIIRDAVLDLKFRRWSLSGRQLGEAFGRVIHQRLAEFGYLPCEVLIVPIPITHRRRIRRGVDHTLVLGRGVSKTSGIGIARLLRARNRAEQIGLSESDRTQNMRGAFFAASGFTKELRRAPNRQIRALIVLDDVRTTGATLEEGCRVLKRALRANSGVFEPEIWAASIAMAGDERKVGSEIMAGNELSSKGEEIEQEDDA